jgi:hypothetical protein
MVDREDMEFARRIAEPLRDREAVEPDFDGRLLSAVRAAANREALRLRDQKYHGTGGSHRSFAWLLARRRLEVSPLVGLAAAACFAAVIAVTTLALSVEPRMATRVAVTGETVVNDDTRQLVYFAIVAPTASKVTLVGDFNAWDTSTTPMVKGAVEGLWLVTMPLDTGSYQYAFVVDGVTWIADPAAPVALEDEFGTPSSILTIREGSA